MGHPTGENFSPYSFNRPRRQTAIRRYNYEDQDSPPEAYEESTGSRRYPRRKSASKCNALLIHHNYSLKRSHCSSDEDEAEDEGSLDGRHFANHRYQTRRKVSVQVIEKSASDGEQNIRGGSMYDDIKGEGRRAKRLCMQRLTKVQGVDLDDEQNEEPPKKDFKSEPKVQINGNHEDEEEEEVEPEVNVSKTRSKIRKTPLIEPGSSTEEEEEDVNNQGRRYSLRKRASEPMIGIVQTRELRTRTQVRQFEVPMQTHRRFPRTHHRKHRRPAHNASDSDSDSSSSEGRFQRKKAAKLDRIRESFLPLNMTRADLMKGTINERVKVGTSMADIQPMTIDRSITFESIGGLDEHIDSLKEMVLFPLLYPEIFDKFKVQVPRGVLFYGPPGTGKTLVARALANECSVNGKKIAFFMRKGADCMSKWVGESERQLRCLFDQAYTMRPSIIFFDEIDGIAPVRSTRQDQIHSSIVSTLLALMDGLDSRGEIIVIGATNRIEAIDPALRRPGRFDREFHFPLPSYIARKEILMIHTKKWDPKPEPDLIETLAGQTVGYCGADLKALCSEAVLLALKRRYKQIYKSKNRLKIDLDSIAVTKLDFDVAITGKIVPAAQRSVSAFGRPLPVIIRPLLHKQLLSGISSLKQIFPYVFYNAKSSRGSQSSSSSSPPSSSSSSNSSSSIVQSHQMFDDQLLTKETVSTLAKEGTYRSIRFPGIFRPRLMILGEKDFGQRYIASALLHETDQSNQFKLDATRTAEDMNIWFTEAIKKLPIPSIIYIPSIEELEEHIFQLLTHLLSELEPTTPLMVLATCHSQQLPSFVSNLFDSTCTTSRTLTLQPFTLEERIEFFTPLLTQYTKKPVIKEKVEHLEVLAEEEECVERKLNERELSKLRKREAISLRQLRNFLRDVLGKVIRDRRFGEFVKPVDVAEVPDYHEVIQNPMDLETMMLKIDSHCYETARQFLDDIELITSNALEYNPWKDTSSKMLRHRAHALRDFAFTLIENEMDSDFESMCQEMHQNRQKRGEACANTLPNFQNAPADQPSNSNYINSNNVNSNNNNTADGKDATIDESNLPLEAHQSESQAKLGDETEIESISSSSHCNDKSAKQPEQESTKVIANGSALSVEDLTEVESMDSSTHFNTSNESVSKSTPADGQKSVDNQAKQNESVTAKISRRRGKSKRKGKSGNSKSKVEESKTPAVRPDATNESSNSGQPQTVSAEPMVIEEATANESQPSLQSQPELMDGSTVEEDLTLVLDERELGSILQKIGSITEGCGIDQLENLYWRLFRTIHNYTSRADRTQMTPDLMKDIEWFTSSLSRKLITLRT